MQNINNVLWDPSLVNLNMIYSDQITREAGIGNLFSFAIKITTGAPSATKTAGYFIPGATIPNAIDGTLYQNTGTISVPVWTIIDTSTTFSLPATATDSTTTTLTSFALTFSALTSGVGQKLTGSGATMTTNGIVQSILMGAATVGAGQVISTTGAYTGTGISKITANNATTGTIQAISATALTSGVVQILTGGGANMLAAGIVQDIEMGAATVGIGQKILTSGVYTGTGVVAWTANALTTGVFLLVSATGLTSGAMQSFTGGGVNMIAGGTISAFAMGAATVGNGQTIVTTGVYTGTGILLLTASSATTGVIYGAITTSSNAIAVGQAIATPAFQVDASTASQIAGIKIKGAVTGGTVAISAIDSGAATSISLDGKGSGTVIIGGISTGIVSIGRGAVKSIVTSSTITALGTTQNSTPTAAQLRGGVVTQTSVTGAGTVTLDNGTNISSAIAGVAVGDTFDCIFSNLGGGQTLTITTASGLTLIGTVAVGTGKTARMTFVNTGTNTWNVYCIVSA